MTGIYMFNLFDFCLQIKRNKNIFNHAIDVLKRNQQYLMRILHEITLQNMLCMIVFFLYCGDELYMDLLYILT